MEFTKTGLDVFTTEVDDKGIDFVIRKNSKTYFDVQVKSIRRPTSYIFMTKENLQLRENILLALVIFEENGDVTPLLIPSLEWKNKKKTFLVSRDYDGKKSKPEWGMNITKSNIEEIKREYNFGTQVKKLNLI